MSIKLSIIVLSYKDDRIIGAIQSIKKASVGVLQDIEILIIDGGSDIKLLDKIQDNLSDTDTLVSEQDEGIFDALNKGLKYAKGEYVGWIGSDDVFLPDFSFGYIINCLEKFDLVICGTIHTKRGVPIRVTPSKIVSSLTIKFGFNNPHFSTFGKTSLFRKFQFRKNIPYADIEYFLDIFAENPKVLNSEIYSTQMELGGTSNLSYMQILKTNISLIFIYNRRHFLPIGVISVSLKILSKIVYKLYSSLNRKKLYRLLSEKVKN